MSVCSWCIYMNLSLPVTTVETIVRYHLHTEKTSQLSMHLTFGKPGIWWYVYINAGIFSRAEVWWSCFNFFSAFPWEFSKCSFLWRTLFLCFLNSCCYSLALVKPKLPPEFKWRQSALSSGRHRRNTNALSIFLCLYLFLGWHFYTLFTTSALSAVALVSACLREGMCSESYLDLGGGHKSVSQLWLNCMVAGDNHVSVWFFRQKAGSSWSSRKHQGKSSESGTSSASLRSHLWVSIWKPVF